jgi:hypothetical protein
MSGCVFLPSHLLHLQAVIERKTTDRRTNAQKRPMPPLASPLHFVLPRLIGLHVPQRDIGGKADPKVPWEPRLSGSPAGCPDLHADALKRSESFL